MSETDNLLKTLDLETLEENLYRGSSPKVGWQRVYGGQVIGQALMAALRTVDAGRRAHSLHGYFIRPGDPAHPIIYEVDRYRDGRSFTTRHVVAVQHGRPIFTMSASFQREEEGAFSHQAPMAPDVPEPGELPDEGEMLARLKDAMPDNMRHYFSHARPIEMRFCEPERFLAPGGGQAHFRQNVWMRATTPLPDDPALHQCVLAYASDMTLLDTSLAPHGRHMFDRSLMLASLDHALWLHRPFRADEWLLFSQDSPTMQGGRGFNRALIYDQAGRLVASAAQEGLIRRRRPA